MKVHTTGFGKALTDEIFSRYKDGSPSSHLALENGETYDFVSYIGPTEVTANNWLCLNWTVAFCQAIAVFQTRLTMLSDIPPEPCAVRFKMWNIYMKVAAVYAPTKIWLPNGRCVTGNLLLPEVISDHTGKGEFTVRPCESTMTGKVY